MALALPPGITGVLLTLWLTGTTLNVMSLMGIVMLAGVAMSNSILIVEFAHQLIAEGSAIGDAIIRACRVRLRPVLMTSLATIIGLMPMAMKLGEGSEAYAPLARALIGGLTVSVIFTVFIVPAGFYLAYLAIVFVVQALQVDVFGLQTFARENLSPLGWLMDRTWHLLLPTLLAAAAGVAVLSRYVFSDSSALTKEVVLDKQLAESVQSWWEPHKDAMLFPVVAKVKEGHTSDEVLARVQAALDDVAAGNVDAKRFEAVKSNLRYSLLMSLTSADSVAESPVLMSTGVFSGNIV